LLSGCIDWDFEAGLVQTKFAGKPMIDKDYQYSVFILVERLPMSTTNIDPTDVSTAFVSGGVAVGEMSLDVLQSMPCNRAADAIKLDALRRHIHLGVMQAEKGEYSDRTVMQIAASVLDEEVE